MASGALPLDTGRYDDLPVSVFLCEPVPREGGVPDARVVYANARCLREWAALGGGSGPVGMRIGDGRGLDAGALDALRGCLAGSPRPFSAYLPRRDLRVQFTPLSNLPAPYAGFLLTDVSGYETQEGRVHFLRNIRQMKNCAVLLRRQGGIRLESVYVSEDFARLLECSQEEARQRMDGAGFVRAFHPEDRPLVRSMLKRHMADGGGSVLTVQLMTARNRIVWCDVHFAFIDDFAERYLYCTYHNVTALKEYEERLRSVYLSMGSSFYQTEGDALAQFRVNLTQDSLEEVKGRDLYPTDALGRSWTEALELRAEHFPVGPERVRYVEAFRPAALLEGYARGRGSQRQMLCARRRDGRMCYVEFSASLTRHPMSGDVIAFLVERQCNADKVRSVLLDKILAKQFDMVAYLVDGRYGVVIGESANIKRGNLFPITRTGEYQHYLETQVLPVLSGTEDQRAAAREALALSTVEQRAMGQEPYAASIAVDMDGATYYKRFEFYCVNPDARFFIVLKSDTTAIHAEQELRNNQLRDALEEARHANAAKTAFLSSMSHEIRTPMNAIIGLDNIALKEPDLPEKTREQLEKIGVSARHLLGLINDILDMSRIESGRMTLKKEEFSFPAFLEQINTLVSSQCQDRGLEYECTVHGTLDDYYIGDDMKLKQVLINILGNAVKFTPPPGRVTLDVERTGQFQGQTSLRFIIQDTGIGMDPDYLPRIFDAFSQEDATTTNRYGGSGLGMAITKNIVEMMNGNIAVASQKGKGSTFTVNVTLRDSERRDRQEMELRPQELRVLVVDDDAVACQHAKLVLEEIGIQADTCESGTEALELVRVRRARQVPYNLILVDLRMPEMDGVELSRRIREIQGRESAIVILTAYNWSDVEGEALQAGVDSFMTKPLFASGVLYEFQQALKRRQFHAGPENPPADLRGKRILVAEDMEINAEIVMELLEMREMVPVRAENGQEAADRFAASQPGEFHAILMDVRMPVMDGLTAAKTIRAMDRPDAKTIPIIAMTANAFDEDVQRSLQVGMDAHLSKPVEPERLYKTLEGLIEESQR